MYSTYGICKKCGWHEYAPFGSAFHMNISTCPSCGIGIDHFKNYQWIEIHSLKITLGHWESQGVWWKPWTWKTEWVRNFVTDTHGNNYRSVREYWKKNILNNEGK